jgi:hypothetical protein
MMKSRYFKLAAALLGLFTAFNLNAYDFPLSPEAIREAYFLGKQQGGLGAEYLSRYIHAIPGLKAGELTSSAKIETPFTQVTERAAKASKYSAQDAQKEFLYKPATVRLYLEICYKPDAPPNAVKIKVVQYRKEIVPQSSASSPYLPASDKSTPTLSVGEHVKLDFAADQFQASELKIEIDTPDGQHAETIFDLDHLR